MRYTVTELREFSKNFTEELLQASKGAQNSLLFAKNSLPKVNFVQQNQEFQVIMIGGSHLESATARINQNKVLLTEFYQYDIPKLTTKEMFLQTVSKAVNPETKLICINFAFPIRPIFREKKLDGVLLRGPKGHDFEGLIGLEVGLEVEKYILENLKQKVDIILANDTVALGLATKEFNDFTWENSVVGIVGTGTNFGIFESQDTFINIESGNFNKFKQSESGKIIDLESSNALHQWFEKEVGGEYLVKHFNLDAKLDGLDFELESSKELGNILEDIKHPCQHIVADIFSRSSQLIAAQIYGIWEYKNLNSRLQEGQKLMLLMEGSLYWKGFEYSQKVDFYLKQLGLTPQNYEIRFLENMGLKGISRLGYLD